MTAECESCGKRDPFYDKWEDARDDWNEAGLSWIKAGCADWVSRGGTLSEELKKKISQE